ncbi:hypothetical protein ACR9YC_02105 [Parasphingorhabdus sp. DH2-15]|uniref:hypothetical protein n=1 Tax=Parasphingorhabdus sp. DH2-15 TaxID=3444112 RepID=UPI003F685121
MADTPSKKPDLDKDFESANDRSHSIDARREAFLRDRRIHQTPASRKEVEVLKTKRVRQTIKRETKANGAVRTTVDRKVESERERRIHFLESWLNRRRGDARDDFKHSR